VKLLVAGIGNIFFGDDGFGPEVARMLAAEPIADVTIVDYGIRGLDLAYDLTSGYDGAIFIDAVPRGGTPGTLYVIEPEVRASAAAHPDPHTMNIENVFAFVRAIGGELPPLTIVGCEPSGADETIGLTEPVRRAVQPAVDLVRRLVAENLAASHGVERRSSAWTEV
jgi:hydrogenase maturation protease